MSACNGYRQDHADDLGAVSAGGLPEPPDDTAAVWPRRPCDTDQGTPSVARVYNAYMGGAANQSADRAFAEQVRTILPDVRTLAVANRLFLARAVRYCVRQGLRQIIDIGAGIPSIWDTHLVAHSVDESCRVVYVDHEAVACEAIRPAIADDTRLGVVRADVRDVEAIVQDPVVTGLLDFSRPVVLVMGLLLHFIPDDDNPAGVLARYRHAVAPGSYVVISHDTADGREADMRRVAELYAQAARPLALRDHAALAALLGDIELVDPGIVHMPLWRPDADDPVIDPPQRACVYAAVGKT